MKKFHVLTILLFIGSLSFAQQNSLHFDGANDVVDLTNNSIFDITDSITLEAWIFPTTYITETDIISKFGDIPTDDSYMLRLANGVPFIQIKIGDTWYVSSATTALNLNTWHHIAGVYDGTQLKIFVNGVLKNSVGLTGNINLSVSTVKIGRWVGSASSFSGNIDEVRIWNIARSNAEIDANYTIGLSGNDLGLVAYYRFNQGIANGNNLTETSLIDLSSSNVNGSLNNFNLIGTTSNWVGGVDSLCGGGITNTITQTICAGDSIIVNGTTYSSTVTGATETVVDIGPYSCDSTITINLTVIAAIDTSVIVSGTTITSNQTGASYQWIDCNNENSVIDGATDISYVATSNGSYAVVSTVAACSDTSSCVNITTVGIIENSFGRNLLVYPNPTHGNFSIDFAAINHSVTVTITDLKGNIIQSNQYSASQLINLKLDEPAGVYFLKVESENKKTVIRLIKE